MTALKRSIVLILAVCVAMLFGACQKSEPISFDLGEFEYEQMFTDSLDDAVATDGYTFLVIYLTPAEDTEVTLDEAHEYFYQGTQAVVDGETYDLYCLAFEEVGGSYVRFGLLFEVKDNGYSETSAQPEVQLILP